MATLLIALGAFLAYFVAYHTYGKWLSQKIFQLDPERTPPSRKLEDGHDFVPTHKSVVFGHHFTSIAGTGPIVGPALAVIWGWVPALLWVLFGSIFIGAVHDLGALVVSLRNRGQTVGDIAGRVLSSRARLLFLSVLFLALTIVLAIFGLVIAAVFKAYPAAIFPCLIQIPLAVLIGSYLHRKGKGLLLPSLLSLALMYLTVAFGDVGFLHSFNSTLADWPVIVWVVLLLLYSYVASVLPVWLLLQPRDYINSLQLVSTLALVVLGLFAAAFFGLDQGAGQQSLSLSAPAIRLNPEGAPFIFPFLFITIACGAISGFHCLVSSGTSSKQLANERDAHFVGYGSMLTEGFLATIVILACVAGLGLGIPEIINQVPTGELLVGEAAYQARYASWGSAAGLAAKVGAFVDGAANLLKALGLPAAFAVAVMGVFVASFAATTLDSACRLQRYVVQELADQIHLPALKNKHLATVFAVLVAGIIAAVPGPGQSWEFANLGKGGLLLWPLFGATNQLLGGLAFLVILFWLRQKQAPTWFLVPPAVLMLILPGLAMALNLFQGDAAWLTGVEPNYLLSTIAAATMVLEVWIIAEGLKRWCASNF
ncbi:carbon starvation protein A [Roseibacillus ishigakijimensis]|uniref:Carbon starvation protein A n=2 Tax=Roseibacillus ishigakijimensis TaxID=454146 RepID=A0A934VNM8_9BACT|nr:carbon starvation protein A [Roseibacillus ishigakijimensis]MBK1835190.1 carbon starvation protein A [Roseibacillus ishigakijimensis]